MRLTPLLLLPGITLTAPADATRIDFSRIEHRQEDLAMGAGLWIRQGDGRVSVEGWDRSEISVEARFQDDPKGGRAELQLRAVEGGMEVEVREPRRPGFFLGRFRPALCHLEIKVPHHLRLSVRSVDGAISVRDLDGFARCESVDGAIHLERLRGEAVARSVDGRIEARDLQARIKGCTVDGDIRLERVSGGVDLNTSDGDIEAMDLDGGGEGIFLTTVDGRIRLKLGEAKGSLDARTGDGDLEALALSLQIQEMGAHRLRARIPGREQSICLRTGDGDIRVE